MCFMIHKPNYKWTFFVSLFCKTCFKMIFFRFHELPWTLAIRLAWLACCSTNGPQGFSLSALLFYSLSLSLSISLSLSFSRTLFLNKIWFCFVGRKRKQKTSRKKEHPLVFFRSCLPLLDPLCKKVPEFF